MHKLIEAAERVGVELRKTGNGGNLYVWHTPSPEDAVVYIGKSASDLRVENETRWRDGLDPRHQIVSGIVTLLRVNHADLQAFHYDPASFDGRRWRDIRLKNGWSGSLFDRLDSDLPAGYGFSASTVEKLLVRIAVRYGVPIGNSQFGSQWENPIGTVSDTLAALAVDADPSFEVPEPDARGDSIEATER
ncbi:hypothetical protein [Amycolatopsis sp. NPDC051372]|uniref:hypothetical protein n=1 Tax=Amycolatopsis sp. NPDC051372 TaxID=3155669 RepID=UPI00342CE865